MAVYLSKMAATLVGSNPRPDLENWPRQFRMRQQEVILKGVEWSFGFNVPLTTRSWRRDLVLKSHPKEWRSGGSNQRPQDCRISTLTTAPRPLLVLEGVHSKTTEVTSWVPQGTVLGPLLFLVYINDMPEKLSSTTRLFADDSLVYRFIRSKEDQVILREDLDRLQKWERDWLM